MRRTLALDERTLVVLPLGVAALVYLPILRNYFVGGDFLNFYDLLNRGLGEFLLTPHGGHVLVTRNFIWWLLHQCAGMRAGVYFATVLASHLVVVGLVFEALRRLTGSARAAAVAAALWGGAPVHDGTLGWYSVYGQVFATGIMVWLLLGVGTRTTAPGLGRVVGWGLLLFAGATSFGTGIATALALPVAAFVLWPRGRATARAVALLALVGISVALVCWGLVRLYTARHGLTLELAVGYTGLDFPRAILALLGLLVSNGMVSLLCGVFASRVELTGPVGLALVGGSALTLLLVYARGGGAERRLVLAALVLCVACYGIIAVGRAPFYASTPTPAYARAARYQYAGMVPLALCLAVMLAHAGTAVRVPRAVKDGAVAAVIGTLVLTHLLLGSPIEHYDGPRRETAAVLEAIRAAAHAAPAGGDIYIDNRPFAAIGPLLGRRPDLFPGWVGVFVIFFPDNVVDGRRMFFVADEAVVAAAQRGRRTQGLVVTDAQRPRPLGSVS